VETLVGSGLSDGLEGLEVLHLIGDSHSTRSLSDSFDGHNLSSDLGGLGDLLLGGVSLLGLLGVQGEEDELALVLLQALGVQLKGLNRVVPASEVDGNAHGPGVVLAETGGLDLLQGESTSGPLLDVVLEGGA